jgi:hypothetical protein
MQTKKPAFAGFFFAIVEISESAANGSDFSLLLLCRFMHLRCCLALQGFNAVVATED